ncbi:hypothetical protein [Salinibaculum salinum]|uniref:hypothetical protein n=1 Tax=Salinibaculum salinum TaxID=3131996 RepID=UPI0030EF0220
MEPDIPQRPPLEIVEQGRVWVLEAYQQGTRKGTTYSTHDSQIDAVRAAKTKMDDDRHPCTLRWDSPRSVGNLYWNPLFEQLVVRYDELLDAWTVVPERGTCAIEIADSRREACERARRIQREYNFKNLHAYDATGTEFEDRDHRFLRYDITASGVRFDHSAIEEPTGTSDEDTDSTAETDEVAETYVGPTSPGQLGASIPDVTKVEFADTDGILHQYATPWGDGTDAEILAVSRKYVDTPGVDESFETRLTQWRTADDHPNIATIHESGLTPAQWVAYRAGEYTLADTGTDLPVEARLSILRQVADAVDTVETVSAELVCGLHPEKIHVQSAGTGSEWRATVTNWGLEWALQNAVGTHRPTPFTAPEQINGHLTATTAVYQFGALAYWLLCESPPVSDDTDTATAVQAGDIPPANPISAVARDTGAVIDRALETDPEDRYRSVSAVCRNLIGRA